MVLTDAMLAPFQAALDSLVGARLKSRDQARALDGKVLLLRLTGLDLHIYVCAQGERLVLRGATEAVERAPEATLSGSIPAFIRAIASKAEALPEGLALEGDAELVRDLRALVYGLELDLEERLSKVTGDPLAHGLGEALRRGGRAFGYAGDRLVRDVAEYLREETRDLVSKQEVASFNDGVDRMRDDVERFAARMAQVEADRPAVKP